MWLLYTLIICKKIINVNQEKVFNEIQLDEQLCIYLCTHTHTYIKNIKNRKYYSKYLKSVKTNSSKKVIESNFVGKEQFFTNICSEIPLNFYLTHTETLVKTNFNILYLDEREFRFNTISFLFLQIVLKSLLITSHSANTQQYASAFYHLANLNLQRLHS